MLKEGGSAGAYGAVLVMVDQGASSAFAAEIAAELAERSEGTLHVVAVPRSGSAPGGPEPDRDRDGSVAAADQPESHGTLADHVASTARSVGSRWDCPVETAVIVPEHPSGGLADYESMQGVGLTVVAGPEPGDGDAAERAGTPTDIEPVHALGSETMEHLPSPVLMVPVRARGSTGPDGYSLSDPDPVAVLLGPSDTNADASLPAHAARFAAISGAELWLVDSSPSGSLLELDTIDPQRPQPEEQEVERRERLTEMASVLRSRGLNVHHEIVSVGAQDPRRALSRFLREQVVGTVAVGPEGRTVAERLGWEGVRAEGEPSASASTHPVAVLLCPAQPPEGPTLRQAPP